MRRTLTILALSTLALLAMLVAAAVVAFETPFGRRLLASAIESELGEVFGGKAHIGALDGRLPARIVLRDVEIRDDVSVWLTAETISVDWRPLALIRGKISIDSLAISGVDVLREPAEARRDKATPEARGAVRLPRGLPALAIRNLALSQVRVSEAVAGRPIVLDGAGAVRMGGDLLKLRFVANSENASDFIDATIELDPSSDHGLVDILLASEAGGAIASLLDLGGPAYLKVEGEAPLSRFTAKLAGEIGAYGALEAWLASDLSAGESLSVDAKIAFGGRLASISSKIGPDLFLQGEIRRARAELAVVLTGARAEAGAVSGVLRWTNRGDRIEKAHAALDFEFTQARLPEIRNYLGPKASVEIDASLGRGGYGLDAELVSPTMTVSLRKGRTDLRRSLAGHLSAELAPNQERPAPFREGVEAAAEVSLGENSAVALRSFELTLADGSSLAGDGAYGGEDHTVSFAGDATITPAFIKGRISAIEPGGPLVARLTATGTANDFSMKIEAESSEARMNGAAIPAADISARLTGLPNKISAALTARPIGRKGELTLLFRETDAGSFSLPRVHIESPSLDLSGSGAWNAASEAASIDMTYLGKENAEPYPGLPLSGSLSVKGDIGRRAGATELHIEAQNLVSDDFAIGALELRASGPSDRFAFDIDAGGVTAPVAGLFDTIEAHGVANLTGAPRFRFDRFAALRAGEPISLTAPATLIVGEEIRVENLRAQYGAKGRLALDGRFSPRLWRAEIAVTDLPLAGANSVAAFNIALDTDKPLPARGDFALKSLFSSGDVAEIQGVLSWDGKRAHLADSGEPGPLDFEIDAPLLLTRRPKLSVTAEGPVSGHFAYAGALQALTPYFPQALQTLEGDIEARARISGTLDRPAIDGEFTIRNGAYTEIASGLTLTGVHMDARSTSVSGDTAIDFNAGARGAGQKTETVAFEGTIKLGKDSSIDADLRLDGAAFSAGPINRATASGAIRFTGPLASANAAGALTVGELDAEIVAPPTGGLVDIAVVAKGGDALQPVERAPPPPPFTLDIKASADDRVFIRGRGLESEWRADIRAVGEARNPTLIGALVLRRGTLDFSGRRFTFTRGEIAFDRLSPNDPALDLRAEYKTREDVTAAIEVAGRASAPAVSLVSSPARSPEDIMALILFGKPAQELSALESLQVAEALAQLSGVGPFGKGGGITGVARRALGLNLLNLNLDPDAGASSLEVGKYVVEGLFVSAKQDARGENGSVRVEYEITDSISIETEMKQDGDQTVSANWKRDF